MKRSKRLFVILSFLVVAFTSYSQGYHKRIAFVGNSITYGYLLTDYAHERFSTLVDTMLRHKFGDTCIVGNYSVSGRTMLKKGDYPLWNEPEFTNCWQFAPDIVIILLGTNDSKPQNWDYYGDEFFGDYISMIDTFKLRNPQAKFIVCLPPPAFKVVYSIRDSVIINGIIPLIDSVASVTGSALLDFYHPLLDSVNLFADYIHPNKEGHKVMAQMIYDKLMQTDYIHQIDTGYTFVDHFASSSTYARDKDSITLNWTTINADSAFLNGKAVPPNGSEKVNAKKTTTYTLTANGALSTDSLKLTLEFYHPVLSYIMLNPTGRQVHESDTVSLYLNFEDQKRTFITDTAYTVNWSIISGGGSLIDQTGNAAKYVAGKAGTAEVVAKVDTVSSNISTITINPSVDIANTVVPHEDVSIYPNPTRDILNVTLWIKQPSVIKVKLYSITGKMNIRQDQYALNEGEHTLTLRTKDLPKGIYFLEIDLPNKHFVKKIDILGNQ